MSFLAARSFVPRTLLLFASGGLSLIPPVTAADTPWHLVPGRLTTEWGDQVTPENAWREYPRPQFVRSEWSNLNGLWDFAVTRRTDSSPQTYEGKILVPFAIESALSGVGRRFAPDDRLWYRRTWTRPAEWKGQRVLLHFGAVDFSCSLSINGALVGAHEGGSEPFTFDVTDYVKDAANELVLAVTDPTDSGEQPRGKQQLDPKGIWYTPVSGIWQTVWAEPVPRDVYLAELRLTPDLPNSRLRVAALTNIATEDDALAVRLTATAADRVVASTVVRCNREGWLDIPSPHAWSPTDPFLYDLKAELIRVEVTPPQASKTNDARPRRPSYGAQERAAYAQAKVQSGAVLDRVSSYFALREVSVGPGAVAGQPQLKLNGQVVFQHGPLDQGWWPDGLLTPPSDAAMVWELTWLKKAGFNMLRKHIKIEPSRYYYHCDRLGLMVWQDMPSGYNRGLHSRPDDEGDVLRLSTSREQHELELRRMIDALYNHPSIVMWVVFNEGWGQYETASLSRWVKAIDPSRWCNAASGWTDLNLGDVFDLHTYEPTPRQPALHADRAVVVGEYGGVGWPVADHLWDTSKRNWGYQTYTDQPAYVAALKTKLAGIAEQRRAIGLSAAVYTQTTDVEGEVNGFLTYDRRFEKISGAALQELNRHIVGPLPAKAAH